MAANWRRVIAPLVILSVSLGLVLSCPSRSFLLLRNLPSRSTALADPAQQAAFQPEGTRRSEEHTSELQSLMRISYAVFCLKKKTNNTTNKYTYYIYHKYRMSQKNRRLYHTAI